MPCIIISLSLLAALGIAIYENPQVKEWIEEQRRKITEALRSLGDDIDPQTRREAEAFAFEGRLPNQPRERAGSAHAVAVATGREQASDGFARRGTGHASQSLVDEEERRRLGREYLARRNQQMWELKQRRESVKSTAAGSPTGSFDSLVNSDGTLRVEEKALPSPPSAEPRVSEKEEKVREMEAVAPGMSGLQAGSRCGNPFSDEYEFSDLSEMGRSVTPKPPVPPKIALEKEPAVAVTEVPGAFSPQHEEAVPADLSYDEQLARALSLSLAESEAAAQKQMQEEDDTDMARAIAASLAEARTQKAAAPAPSRPYGYVEPTPLVDLTPNPPISIPETGMNEYHRALSEPSTPPQPHDEDDLYTLSPQFTQRRLAHQSIESSRQPPYDPVHEAAATHSRTLSPATSPSPAERDTPATLSASPQLVDIDSADAARTPTLSPADEAETLSFTSDEDAFASLSASRSSWHDATGAAAASRRGSNASGSVVEIEDVDMESVDSEVDDGILTPDSWSDVGSVVDEGSEVGVHA
ncbi:hypothetical protein H2203_005677 [Taxawa tesnikishii (nom. ined.)]|nr:hypothetical protein H2203_005677 [Dothideales sp. JES 119]